MEPFETRRKVCRATAIVMVVVAIICCFVPVIIVKSTDILANSMEGVQSTEIDSMAIQWVFKQSQGFKACTIVFCVIECIEHIFAHVNVLDFNTLSYEKYVENARVNY